MWIGNASSRCACRKFLFAFCKLLIVGFEVSLADRGTLAHKSTRVLVDNHCSDPLIPCKVVKPAALSFVYRLVGVGSLVGCVRRLTISR